MMIEVTAMDDPKYLYRKMIFEIISDRMIETGDALHKICKNPTEIDGVWQENPLPSKSAILKWMNEDEKQGNGEFVTMIARARELMADASADRVLDIANRTINGEINPKAAGVAIGALMWDAAKKRPKRYGVASKVTIDGEVKTGDTINNTLIITSEDAKLAFDRQRGQLGKPQK